LRTWHCILSAELTKTHYCFFGNFAHLVGSVGRVTTL